MKKNYLNLVSLLLLNIQVFANNAGALDPSFGTKGLVLTDFNDVFTTSSGYKYYRGFQLISSTAIQSDSKIVAGGYTNALDPLFDFALARYKTDGTLDISYGTKGVVVTSIANILGFSPTTTYSSFINSIALQTNDYTIAAGYSNANSAFVNFCTLARYKIDGSLDTTFGTNGVAMNDIGQVAGYKANLPAGINGVALQADGKIVGCGVSAVINIDGSCAVVRYNIDGSLDSSFGTNGVVIFNIGKEVLSSSSTDSLQSVVLQTDGKIVLGGYSNVVDSNFSFVLVRLNTDGSFDSSFGANGIVITDFAQGGTIAQIQIQTDGKIVAGGSIGIGGSEELVFGVARYNTNGTLDNSFGTNGIATAQFSSNNADILESIQIQSDGKIVASGQVGDVNSGLNCGFARYNTDGSLDSSFGTGGLFVPVFVSTFSTISASGDASSISILNSGQIIAGGFSDAYNNNYDFALLKINTNGTLDTSFGTNQSTNPGLETTDFKDVLGLPIICTNGINSALILPSGKIIVGGYTSIADPNYDFAIAQYNSDGSLDESVGLNTGANFTDIADTLGIIVNPIVFLSSKDRITSLALQSSGNIIAAGISNVTNNFYSFALVRYDSSLNLDTSFGENGVAFTNIGIALTNGKSYSNDSLNSIAIQSDDKIIAAGSTTALTSQSNFAFVKYLADGSFIDTSFGNAGIVVVNVSKVLGLSGTSNDSINSIVLQSDGKILAAGYSTAKNPLGDFAVARFNVDGSLDTTFGTNGIVLTNIGSISSGNSTSQNVASGIVLLSDGAIVVGGLSTAKTTYNPNNPNFNFALAKYKSNGDLDTTFGTKGVVLTAFSDVLGAGSLSNDQLNTIALAPGEIIIAGGATNVTDPNFCYGIAAYNSKGQLVKNFGTNGVTVTEFRSVLGSSMGKKIFNSSTGSNDIIATGNTIVVQPNGDIIATGTSNLTNPQYDFSLAKYKGINACASADTFIQALINKYGF